MCRHIASVAAVVLASAGCKSASTPAPAPDPVKATSDSTLDEGRQTFRFETFGDETFWGATIKLHQAIAGRVHVARALDGVQRIAKGLRPPALDDMGLAEALDRLGMDLAETHGLRVDTLAQLGEQRLPTTVETTLYRIAQEALANVRKHACAKTVSIVIRRAPARVVLIIEDDGQGFDADRITSTQHLGLLGMRERAALLGGTLLVESTSSIGTRIHVSIPVEGNP